MVHGMWHSTPAKQKNTSSKKKPNHKYTNKKQNKQNLGKQT